MGNQTRREKHMKKILAGLVALPFLGILVLVSGKTDGVSMTLKTRVLSEDCSPDTLDYGPFSPYCAGIVRYTYLLATKCEIVVAKKMENSLTSGYGYASPLKRECEPPSAVSWKAGGVTFHYADGDIVIPSGSFTGGR